MRKFILAVHVTVLAAIVLPLFWVAAMSLLPRKEILGGLTQANLRELTLSNYERLVDTGKYVAVFNSLAIGAAVMAMAFVLGWICAFRRADRLSSVMASNLKFVAFRAWPAIIFAVPLFSVLKISPLSANLLIASVGILFANAGVIMWLFDYVKRSISRNHRLLSEVVGASLLQKFFWIEGPLATLELVAVTGVFFLLGWSEGVLATVLTSFHGRPITAEFLSFQSSFGTDWGVLASLLCVSFVPILLLLATVGLMSALQKTTFHIKRASELPG